MQVCHSVAMTEVTVLQSRNIIVRNRVGLVHQQTLCIQQVKVVPVVPVLLSTSIECTVFRIFLRMSDHPWKETSVRAALRCV